MLKRAERFVEHLMDHHDRMNAEAEESPSHLGHEMSPTSAAPMAMEHDHRGMMEQDLRRRFFVVLVLTIPVLALSPTIQSWAGYRLPSPPAASLILAALASIITLYGGLPFFHGAGTALRARTADMDVLVSLAIVSGYLYSLGATFLFAASDFYWEISTLVLFLLFGHWMEMRSVRGASGALQELVKLIPPTANRVRPDGPIEEVATARLVVGDVVLVRPGEKVPIDGVVLEGESSANEALVTGEASPVPKREGDEVLGGTLNGDGVLRVRVTKADSLFALTLMITVFVIACPHALGLAIPTVTVLATTMGAQRGLLIRNAEGLEIAKDVHTVVFDKTGTLTRGEFGVSDVIALGGWSETDLLRIAAAVERNSEHVIAKAIVARSESQSLGRPDVFDFAAIPGKGARAKVERHAVALGNQALLRDVGLEPPEEAVRLASQGKSIVHIAVDGQVAGIIALADLIRDESREAIADLKTMGIRVAMLTGDNRATAAYAAGQLGIETVFAEVLPGDKAATIERLQKEGQRVAMVGDGVNDAPALVQADVGIAIGAGTDVAMESADIVLVRNDPRDVVRLIRLSRLTSTKMRQNLVWATGYNAVALPLAAGVGVPAGVVLRPEWGALFMAASSIIVVANALLMKRQDI